MRHGTKIVPVVTLVVLILLGTLPSFADITPNGGGPYPYYPTVDLGERPAVDVGSQRFGLEDECMATVNGVLVKVVKGAIEPFGNNIQCTYPLPIPMAVNEVAGYDEAGSPTIWTSGRRIATLQHVRFERPIKTSAIIRNGAQVLFGGTTVSGKSMLVIAKFSGAPVEFTTITLDRPVTSATFIPYPFNSIYFVDDTGHLFNLSLGDERVTEVGPVGTTFYEVAYGSARLWSVDNYGLTCWTPVEGNVPRKMYRLYGSKDDLELISGNSSTYCKVRQYDRLTEYLKLPLP